MARIRTIKPEFWSHPIMGRLPGDTKALAIALLNLADDEGYFFADPSFVRGFAEPFSEDSRKIHGRISELCSAGWIEVRVHPSHGAIGKVVNFALHQVINRPNHSKIKDYFDSLNDHGVFMDQSVPEGKGRERNGKEGNRESLFTSEDKASEDEVQRILQEWNSMAQRVGIHQSRGVGPILKTLRQKVKQPGWVDLFLGALPFIEGSPFYHGKNDRGWKANLDWLLRPGKVEELTGREPEKPKNGTAPEHRRNADEALLAQFKEMGMA